MVPCYKVNETKLSFGTKRPKTFQIGIAHGQYERSSKRFKKRLPSDLISSTVQSYRVENDEGHLFFITSTNKNWKSTTRRQKNGVLSKRFKTVNDSGVFAIPVTVKTTIPDAVKTIGSFVRNV